jgi:carbamoyltransferase
MSIKILGISAYYHDAAAVVLVDGEIVAAAQEERFTRKKHDPSFPVNAVSFCLDYSGISLADVDAVVFYDKPWLKFERLLETYYVYAPKGLRSFLAAMPVWIKEKLFLKNLLRKQLAAVDPAAGRVKILFSNHHLSHAASAFFPSPFDDAAILTIDGVGEWATASLGRGTGNTITLLKELRFPHSVGLLYSAFTYYLGFRVNSGEYKLMGLAPYGAPSSERVDRFIKDIYREIVTVCDDGSISLNQDYFNYATGLTMVREDKWEKLFGMPRRLPESDIEQPHCDLAMAIQRVTEDIVLKMAAHLRKITGSENLVMAGGVALNCVANTRLLKENIFKSIWIQPAAGDAGGALGAAYAVYHACFGSERKRAPGADAMRGSFLGPEFSEHDIRAMMKQYGAVGHDFKGSDGLFGTTAELIAGGNIVGWFQSRMEWGPRALGNRSIVGDPRNKDIQKRMNLKIKYRESFRPFAPSVLEEYSPDYFDSPVRSPYMLLVADVATARRIELPAGYHKQSIRDKLYFVRSDIPAVTHLDYSARFQTVSRQTNPRFWQLIDEFRKITGYPVVVNTSFNVRGEPIVCTPEDAYRCFMRTDMDYLVLGDFLFSKKDQPEWKEKTTWKQDLVLD